MKYRRYGKFNFHDYWLSWIWTVFLMFLATTCFIIRVQPVLVFLVVGMLIYILYSVFAPHRETFSIDGKHIVATNGNKNVSVMLSSDLILIVSYADICTPFVMRTSIRNQTYHLKGRYAISLIKSKNVLNVLELLHLNYTKKYTNCSIEFNFKEQGFIYSFICEENLLEKLILEHQCIVIVPESLVSEVKSSIRFADNIYVDIGF